MTVANGLRKLAQQLQDEADLVLEEAESSQPLFELVADVIASAVVHLEKTADVIEDKEPMITSEIIETVAVLADALDQTGDELLQKKASQLDALLMTMSARKEAIAEARHQSDAELARLRDKYRSQNKDEIYNTRTRSHLDEMNKKKAHKKQLMNR